MKSIHSSIVRVIKNGIKHGQLKNDIKVERLASVIISALEGGIMMAKLTGENKHLSSVIQYLKSEVRQISISK